MGYRVRIALLDTGKVENFPELSLPVFDGSGEFALAVQK
jgi:hypothetical protein